MKPTALTAQRTIDLLDTLPAGSELTSAEIAKALGVPLNNMRRNLMPAVRIGEIKCRQLGWCNAYMWSLARPPMSPGKPLTKRPPGPKPKSDEEDDAPVIRRIVPAAQAERLATRAARSVFELAEIQT